MKVDVIFPWAPNGCPHREAAFRWVVRRWQERHPDYRLVLGEHPPGPWVKAKAVMPYVYRSTADRIVVADADVWCDGIRSAVESGRSWAIPHRDVCRLTEAATEAVLNDEPMAGQPLAEPRYLGAAGGGIVVADRDVLLDVPLDHRFVGWGSEDLSWGWALGAIYGPAWRGSAPLYHLWHPPQQRVNRSLGSRESKALQRRYQAAKVKPARMRALIDEAKAESRMAA